MSATTTRAHGTIQVSTWDPRPYDTPGDGPRLVEIHVEEAFDGDIVGTGTARYLQTLHPNGSASFCGLERVTGTLHGRTGTFVLQDESELDAVGARVRALAGGGRLRHGRAGGTARHGHVRRRPGAAVGDHARPLVRVTVGRDAAPVLDGRAAVVTGRRAGSAAGSRSPWPPRARRWSSTTSTPPTRPTPSSRTSSAPGPRRGGAGRRGAARGLGAAGGDLPRDVRVVGRLRQQRGTGPHHTVAGHRRGRGRRELRGRPQGAVALRRAGPPAHGPGRADHQHLQREIAPAASRPTGCRPGRRRPPPTGPGRPRSSSPGWRRYRRSGGSVGSRRSRRWWRSSRADRRAWITGQNIRVNGGPA
ncbi:MAG: hypothetical protein AVDCRST_MAG66-2893 [uncultured Pseudonocardia sp.]|uniref:Uncharacterized protein n=1 Tax=uncultured Pseudonocardia sp. TaxID=211455 RepID=A0A6J4PWL2_9PSEU|nr:MAG: hypothetical protein AVDCRST_MAG66-2893 [uncultured Pseudonocardia sp.]